MVPYEDAAELLHLSQGAAKRFLYGVAYSATEEALSGIVMDDFNEAERAALARLFPDAVAREAALSIAVTWRRHKAVEILRAVAQATAKKDPSRWHLN